MRHVHHEDRARFVGDFADAGEIDDARIGRAAGDDELRFVLFRKGLQLIIIEQTILASDTVLHGVEPFAGKVGRRAASLASGNPALRADPQDG